MTISPYHHSFKKRFFDIIFSGFALIGTLPVTFIISFILFLFYDQPVFFIQKRLGKNGKRFNIIKFRTMIKHAERLQSKYRHLNESGGPAFKIKNDPRFTKVGKILSRTGLDELPQFFNVLKGDMSVVGPRPLPVREALKLTKRQKIRESIKPGITSPWVVNGSHQLTFTQWMALDRDYVKNASFFADLDIILKTLKVVLK